MESIIQQASDICDSLITRNNITESNSLYNEMNVHILLKDAHLMRPACKMVKRVFDIITALIILVFVFPWVYLIIACCIKVCMPGPVMFKQKRTGKDGKIFICYKFRTMDAKNRADEYVDPQMNKYSLGNFLRTTSLDELPQFWNVLKGDMSIVGPRPHMLIHTEQYCNIIPEYNKRLMVKPGITGWAQIHNLRGETEKLDKMKKRVEYDIWYIEHWSFLLDLRIMLSTAKIIFR